MGPKRASDGDPQLSSKLPKLEHAVAANPLPPQRAPNNDFSGSVKKKLADSKRTGQACDRCKIRKIRCDGRPEGCSPCEQNRTPCRTTDRITGRASVRGHTEAMESEINFLRAQSAELQAQLKEMGVEPRPPSGLNGLEPLTMPWSSSSLGEAQTWPESPNRPSSSPLPGYTPASGIEGADFRALPHFKQDSIGDNYLGVSSADSLLSHIKGTSLSVFGSEIDLGDFVENEDDYDKSPMSYCHFLKVTMGTEKPAPVPLPEYSMLKDYSTWYLRSLNPYTMLVDKPTFMQLIWRFGNEANFQPTPSEIVLVQMMLATIKYQIAVRNDNTELLGESHDHYSYSLSLFGDLLHGHTLADVQALTLICHHMRNFPKPGGAWIMMSTTFLLAVELGLHRSVKAWADTAKMSKHEVEMRKRIFWTLLALASNMSGKLGRPMPVRLEDIDVEFPDAVNDCLPGEEANLTDFQKCSFQVGIQIAKYVVWEIELYATVYAVRISPPKYEETLKRLEAGIRQWKEELPYELKDPANTSQQSYIFALYLQYWYQEFQLLLHHPAVCRSTDPAVISSNLDKCLSTSQEMLQNCNELMNKMSLDIPWINTVVFIAAIFTTLFIYNQRKEKLSPVDMTKLKSDMGQWVKVVSECGQLIGSRTKLTNAISKIIDQSVTSINDSIVKRAATESLARAALQAPQQSTNPTSVYGNENFQEQYTDATNGAADSRITSTAPGYNSLSNGAVYPYRNGATTSITPTIGGAFDQPTYTTGEDAGMTPSHAAALAAAASGTTPQQPSETYNFNGTQAANGNLQQTYAASGYIGNDWRQWARTYTQQQQPGQPGEYLNTATTLMALGSREGSTQGPGQDNQTAVDGSAMQGSVATNFQWPGIVFSGGVNGHVGSQ